jgi:hypothetical protein
MGSVVDSNETAEKSCEGCSGDEFGAEKGGGVV